MCGWVKECVRERGEYTPDLYLFFVFVFADITNTSPGEISTWFCRSVYSSLIFWCRVLEAVIIHSDYAARDQLFSSSFSSCTLQYFFLLQSFAFFKVTSTHIGCSWMLFDRSHTACLFVDCIKKTITGQTNTTIHCWVNEPLHQTKGISTWQISLAIKKLRCASHDPTTPT